MMENEGPNGRWKTLLDTAQSHEEGEKHCGVRLFIYLPFFQNYPPLGNCTTRRQMTMAAWEMQAQGLALPSISTSTGYRMKVGLFNQVQNCHKQGVNLSLSSSEVRYYRINLFHGAVQLQSQSTENKYFINKNVFKDLHNHIGLSTLLNKKGWAK